MGQITLQIPQSGQLFSTEGPKVASDMTALQAVINGNLDTTNLTAAVSQSAGVNAGGVVVKGATSIATSESRTNVAYGTLTTPDQVTGIVLPTNGLLAVWYQASWQESVAGAARAAMFLGANQVQFADFSAPIVQATAQSDLGTPNLNRPLYTRANGLVSGPSTATNYTGDVTTGQIVGSSNSDGGPCYIFAAAGTYTVSVQFKASSGSVTASGRKLWVQALSFA
jgi:hypothetical protein